MKKITPRSISRKLLLWGLLLFFMFCPEHTSQVYAAKPASVTSCKLTGKNTVKVSVSIPKLSSVSGKRCYLFAVPLSQNSLKKSDKPIASKTKRSKLTFTVKLNSGKANSRLHSKFLIAAKTTGGTYKVISNLSFISNPQKIAKYNYRFPTASSKKGLQVSASMQEDAVELNVKHSVLNINFAVLLPFKNEENNSASYSYTYHGKTYWFRKSAVNDYDRQLSALKETDSVNSAILLLSWRDDLTSLIYPTGRERGHAYYAWNSSSASSRERLQAAISFLAKRYSPSNGKYGRIVNWIIGNEVNNYNVYHYAGNKSLNQYASVYAGNFRMAYQTILSIYSNARVYISLDHLWNTNTVRGTFAARKMLDAFASKVSNAGPVYWNLAYHPYSCPLTEPRFWANVNGQLQKSLSSPVINMGNIDLLTSYIKNKYGKKTRIILSEQGYTSAQRGHNVEKEQAAAIAYSYLLTESNDMIDSFIMNRHVDHDVEVAQGLNLGLWTTNNPNSPEWADTKKYSWNVFKYMDSSRSESVTSPLLDTIGITDWHQVIPDYNKTLYEKYYVSSAPVTLINSFPQTNRLISGWSSYGAAAASTQNAASYTVIHDKNRNRNCLWGLSRTFSSPISFANQSRLMATLRVNGSTAQNVTLNVRIFSGKQVLESTKVIPANQTLSFFVDLKTWNSRSKVNKIQILLSPAGNGSWRSNASLSCRNLTMN